MPEPAALRVELGTDGAAGSSKEYTLRLESIAALASSSMHEEVLAEVALLKAVQLQLDSQLSVLPQLLATFRDDRALYWVFDSRALCMQPLGHLERAMAHGTVHGRVAVLVG